MIGSLYSGISGLKANTSAMAVIGDNIANVDTTGFKSSAVSFANVFNATLTRTGLEVGRGVTMAGVNPEWGTGALETTSCATDLAVNGTGLFLVCDPSTDLTYYTRAGQFEWDNEGNLVNPDGFIVQGYSIDTDGTIGSLDGINLPAGTSEPSATDEITFGLNLNADAEDGETFTSSVTTYDSLGTEVILDVTFTYDGTTSTWSWTPSSDIGTASTTATTTFTFDSSGELVAPTTNPTITITGLSPAADMSIEWVFIDDSLSPAASDGSITSYSSESTKTAQTQNGHPSGTLQSVTVDEDGYFTGIYSNGSMIPFAQIGLADFPSYSGLAKMGGNLYAESMASGQALVSTPNSVNLGAIAPTSLEMSNVDLADEFVEMITTQRAYQANSKVITSSDEILQELLNIKR